MRSLEEIQKDYAQLCSHAGHLQYQKALVDSELAAINVRLRDLNKEASDLKAKEKENE